LGKAGSKGTLDADLSAVTSPVRLWGFRAIAAGVIPLLFFLLAEVLLRLVGYGFAPGLFERCRVQSNRAYCDNVEFSWRFFPPGIARQCDPFAFPAAKSKDTYRIFVLGESAAKGEPEGAFCFARFLRVMLRAAYPGMNFEVVNVSMAAINSHVVLQIAKDCAAHEPDMFVVYLGNNEVTGPYGAGTVFAPLSDRLWLIRAGIAAKRTRIGQLVGQLVGGFSAGGDQSSIWRGLEMYLDRQVRVDDRELEIVYRHYLRNVEDIVRVASKVDANVMLCTVGSNLKDCPPFGSLHRRDFGGADKQKWDDLYVKAVELEAVGRYAEAAEQYRRAAVMDDDYAELHFRLGRCLWAMGEYERARESYIRARELDTLRFRADDRINQIVRDVAERTAGDGVYLVDAVKAFEEQSPHGTPGEEFFYEHVHLNFVGTYVLSWAIFEGIRETLPQWVKEHGGSEAVLSEEQCAERLGYTGWDRARLAEKVLDGFIKRPPFTNQIDHDKQVEKYRREIHDMRSKLDRAGLEEAAGQYRRAIEIDSGDWWLHWKYGTLLAEELKDYSGAEREFRLVREMLPRSYTAALALGTVLKAQGNIDGAIGEFRRAISINLACGETHYNLGLAYQNKGMAKEAVGCYERAIRWQPECVPAYNNVAEMFMQQGKLSKAEQICRKGLRAVPDSAILHCNLGVLLNMLGRREEGIKEVRKAMELDPNSPGVKRAVDVLAGGM
jgi:tetratricopeptide (TPR) repeat protein